MKTLIMLLTLCASLFAITAQASNFYFLNESAIRYFNDMDWKLYEAAQSKALNNTPDNKKVSWKNPNKNHSGYLIPSQSTHVNGMPCRYLQIFTNADGLTGLSSFQFCKINGEWKIAK